MFFFSCVCVFHSSFFYPFIYSFILSSRFWQFSGVQRRLQTADTEFTPHIHTYISSIVKSRTYCFTSAPSLSLLHTILCGFYPFVACIEVVVVVMVVVVFYFSYIIFLALAIRQFFLSLSFLALVHSLTVCLLAYRRCLPLTHSMNVTHKCNHNQSIYKYKIIWNSFPI